MSGQRKSRRTAKPSVDAVAPLPPHTSDLDLDYIADEAGRLLARAAMDEEISERDCQCLHDIIGELIGEVLRLTTPPLAAPSSPPRPLPDRKETT